MTTWLELPQLELSIFATDLRGAAAARLGLRPEDIRELRVLRRSVDARQHHRLRFLYRLAVAVASDVRPATPDVKVFEPEAIPSLAPVAVADAAPIVVGAGPAGLLAALALCEAGLPPLVVERGRPAPERSGDVEAFWRAGELNPESNMYFGEGGAGTFSDGKLNTRSKNPLVSKVLQFFVDGGAPEEIRWDAKPHIGTDRLVELLPRLRARLEAMGARFRFGVRLTGIRPAAGGRLEAALDGAWTPARPLVLAIGHSAFDTYRLLHAAGVPMEPKPLAVGCRIEHPAEFITRHFYGSDPKALAVLGNTQYNLNVPVAGGKGSVYTFCCCPGGEVVVCAAAPGLAGVNGMSGSRRDSPYTNAGLVTPVGVGDMTVPGAPDAVEGVLRWREDLERRCYELGGGAFAVPGQTAADFAAGRPAGTRDLRTSSRRPVVAADLAGLLPASVTERLREGLRTMDAKLPGWVRRGVLVGVETTTSAPLRLLRTPHGEAEGWPGLLPVGEGSGYAGGIVTSAADGWETVARWLESARRPG